MPGAWAAAVLCGGASRRMGQDKALLVVDGQPMVRRVVTAARDAGAASVITVGGDQKGLVKALAGLDVRVVPDRFPGEGPLGGVLTALDELDAAGEADVVLVLSCDLLAPDPRTMATVAAALTDPGAPRAADVAVPRVAGRDQWLHAAWRNDRQTRERLAAPFADDERSVHRAVAQAGLAVRHLVDLATESLADADTPEDLRDLPGPDSRT